MIVWMDDAKCLLYAAADLASIVEASWRFV